MRTKMSLDYSNLAEDMYRVPENFYTSITKASITDLQLLLEDQDLSDNLAELVIDEMVSRFKPK